MATVAVIGAGFSGTATAAAIVRANSRVSVVLIERSGRFGPGVAYGTPSPAHLLNVPAGRMSALADDPDHFLRWARQRDPLTTGGSFVARSLYGHYLQDLLSDAERVSDGRLRRVVGDVRAMRGRESGADGTQPRGAVLELADGTRVEADVVVLAMGNSMPGDPPVVRESLRSSARYIRDPWAPQALAAIEPDARVVIMGTGLTMLDVVLDLTQRGHSGEIRAFSRRGLIPQPHRAHPKPAKYEPPPGVADWPRTTRGLLREVRREIAAAAKRHVDWREVITSLRPVTAELWGSLSGPERARFLRHVRSFWEVARHRAAPQVDGAIQALMLSGRLVVQAARLVAARDTGSELRVELLPRGESQPVEVVADRLINCTGPETDLAASGDPLAAQLVCDGLVTQDPHGHGIVIDQANRPVARDGRPREWLWVVGPMTRSRYWESTAVPELRAQAAAVAVHVAALVARADH